MNIRNLAFYSLAFLALFSSLTTASLPQSVHYKVFSKDGVFDKPVIFVEGYDPLNEIVPEDYYVKGLDRLIYDNRDLVIVNLPDGGASMDDNATFVQNLIQDVNRAKTGSHPNAIIGYSMGGVVARKALKAMEMMYIDHQTSIYVSYDAPHSGANAPLALQETVESLIDELDSKSFGYTSSSLKRARAIYNSQAAREMLIAGPNYYKLDISSFPDNVARIAITSGSLQGGLQSNSVTSGYEVANFKFYFEKSSWGSWSKKYSWFAKNRGEYYYDNVPGSYLDQYYDAFQQIKAGADYVSVYKAPQHTNITFIPTVSSLAMLVEPTQVLWEAFKYESPFDKYIAVDFSGKNACEVFNLQSTIGVDIRHDEFDYSQISQLKCALDQYHKTGFELPNRFLKQGPEKVAALIMIPINYLLL